MIKSIKLKAGEIADLLGAGLYGDSDRVVDSIKSLDEADENSLSFADEKHLRKIALTKAGVVIVPDKVDLSFLPEKTYIVVEDPFAAIINLVNHFYKEDYGEGISHKAWISSSAVLGKNVVVREFCVIDDGACIGDGVVLMPNVYVGKNVKIGDNTVIFPNVVIYSDCIIGKNCRIHAGTIIGADGFGYIERNGKREKIPQIGRVIIGDDVEIGANVCIDRATFGSTVIEEGVKIDNLVQIAHNVVVGRNTVIAAQTGISGSVIVGKNVSMGGQVGIADHTVIGNGVKIAAQSGVVGRVKDGAVIAGSPAMPIDLWRKVYVSLKKLPEIIKRVKK